jgi:FMN phosphatase YigB (HAD superfamily)
MMNPAAYGIFSADTVPDPTGAEISSGRAQSLKQCKVGKLRLAMRAILFDFGGTLDYPKHWLDRFLTHYRAAGIDIERPQLDTAFSIATRTAYACNTMLRDYSLARLVGYLLDLQFESLGRGKVSASGRLLAETDPARIEELKAQIRDSFVTESAAGFAISRPLLASFARRFKIGVVSNFYGNLERVLAEAGLASWISAITDSGRLGCYKPDPGIFTASLAQLGVHPRQALMVGDSIEKDCAPARALGITAVWLRHSRSVGPEAAQADSIDFTIESLEELENLGWLAG